MGTHRKPKAERRHKTKSAHCLATLALGGTVGLAMWVAPSIILDGPAAPERVIAPSTAPVDPYEITRIRSMVSDNSGGQSITLDVKNNTGQDIFLSEIKIKFSTQSRGYLHASTFYDTVDAGSTETVTVRFTSDTNFITDRLDLYSADASGMVEGYPDGVKAIAHTNDLALTLQDCYQLKRAQPDICGTIKANQRGYDPANLDPFSPKDFTKHLGEPQGGNDFESMVEDAAQSAVMHELG